MSRGEVLDYIDTTIMMAGRCVSRYRTEGRDGELRDEQLYELQMNLEAALGMLDNILERK